MWETLYILFEFEYQDAVCIKDVLKIQSIYFVIN